MEEIKDIIDHIFDHIDAEVSSDDQSQFPGKGPRHAKLRAFLNRHKNDATEVTRAEFVQILIDDTGDPDLLAALARIDVDDDGQKIRLVLQEWVGGQLEQGQGP